MSASFTLTVPTAALPAVQACLEELARQIRAHENSAPLEAPVLAAAERAAVLTSSTVQSNRNSEVEPEISMRTFRGRRRSFIGAKPSSKGPVIEGVRPTSPQSRPSRYGCGSQR